MQQRLIISALGDDHPGIVNEISGEVSKLKCNIEETQVNVFSGEFSILLDVSGKNDAIEKLILSLPELEKKLNLSITFKKGGTRQRIGNVMPYKVKITSMDDMGLVDGGKSSLIHDISDFFANKSINIENMRTSTYPAPHTSTTLFSADLIISLPKSILISQLREELVEYCDKLNIDVSIEPRLEAR